MSMVEIDELSRLKKEVEEAANCSQMARSELSRLVDETKIVVDEIQSAERRLESVKLTKAELSKKRQTLQTQVDALLEQKQDMEALIMGLEKETQKLNQLLNDDEEKVWAVNETSTVKDDRPENSIL